MIIRSYGHSSSCCRLSIIFLAINDSLNTQPASIHFNWNFRLTFHWGCCPRKMSLRPKRSWSWQRKCLTCWHWMPVEAKLTLYASWSKDFFRKDLSLHFAHSHRWNQDGIFHDPNSCSETRSKPFGLQNWQNMRAGWGGSETSRGGWKGYGGVCSS